MPPTATQMDFPESWIDDGVERAADEAMEEILTEDWLVSPEVQAYLDDADYEEEFESL